MLAFEEAAKYSRPHAQDQCQVTGETICKPKNANRISYATGTGHTNKTNTHTTTQMKYMYKVWCCTAAGVTAAIKVEIPTSKCEDSGGDSGPWSWGSTKAGLIAPTKHISKLVIVLHPWSQAERTESVEINFLHSPQTRSYNHSIYTKSSVL